MKRAFVATAVVMMCIVLSGCTLYFGGWATAGGRVVERLDNGDEAMYVPVYGATVTFRSVSNPDYGLNCLTDENGDWITPVRLKCDMYHVTVSKTGYVEVGPFSYPMAERDAHYTMETIVMDTQQE